MHRRAPHSIARASVSFFLNIFLRYLVAIRHSFWRILELHRVIDTALRAVHFRQCPSVVRVAVTALLQSAEPLRVEVCGAFFFGFLHDYAFDYYCYCDATVTFLLSPIKCADCCK